MKARYKYRIYPTNQQQQSLAQLFGSVRVVWNDALALCKQSEKKPSSAELQKAVITQAKNTEERAWLGEVSCIPLQQSVADLEIAFKNFFNSCKGKRKGRQVGYPNFKKRTSNQSARFRIGGFSFKGDEIYLAKVGIVNPMEKFGREFKVISRWEPTSQVCSDCGFKWGKIELSIRSVLCLSCGTEQDRDENAARNIEQVGMGNRHDSKRALRDCKTTLVAEPDEASRITAAELTVSISKPKCCLNSWSYS